MNLASQNNQQRIGEETNAKNISQYSAKVKQFNNLYLKYYLLYSTCFYFIIFSLESWAEK